MIPTKSIFNNISELKITDNFTQKKKKTMKR